LQPSGYHEVIPWRLGKAHSQHSKCAMEIPVSSKGTCS